MAFYLFSNFFIYVLNLFEDEPKDCRIADCTKHLAEKLCPKTCFESKLCKVADCTKPESIKICPNTCAESTKEDIGKKRKTKVLESLWCYPARKVNLKNIYSHYTDEPDNDDPYSNYDYGTKRPELSNSGTNYSK